jgi:hypothetical protein
MVARAAEQGSMGAEMEAQIRKKKRLFQDVDDAIATLGLSLTKDEDVIKLFIELRRRGHPAVELGG